MFFERLQAARTEALGDSKAVLPSGPAPHKAGPDQAAAAAVPPSKPTLELKDEPGALSEASVSIGACPSSVILRTRE
jgi:hypothetical protein